jgi:hypothetical protein
MDPERQARLKRLYELWAIHNASEARRLRGRLGVFELSVSTFRSNYRDLIDTLTELRSEQIPADLTIFEFGDIANPKLEAVSRKIHNYLTSYSSLREHMKVIYEEIYAPAGHIPEYRPEVTSRFARNGLAILVKVMRNIIEHSRNPVVTYTHTEHHYLAFDVSTIDFSFQKNEILRFNGLNLVAKQYVQDLPDKIDIQGLVSAHFKMMNEFCEWFSAKQEEIHREAFAESDRIESELRELGNQEREYFKELAQERSRPAGQA